MQGIDVNLIMRNLSKRQQAFVDVTDFRVSLGREIYRQYPSFFMAMQCPLPELPDRDKMEICLEDNNDNLVAVFDLSYYLDEKPIQINGVTYKQKKNILEIGRFKFFNSLAHIEKIVRNHDGAVGYVIFLTNTIEYWTPPEDQKDTPNNDFQIHEGLLTQPIHSWTSSVKEHRDNATVKLHGQYNLTWHDFSKPCDSHNCLFRYLFVEVHK
ncbi:MAG: hypothetical protein GF411_06940 [Candidatus Lokiarchaeota archaeon]|nr:hypothetical protein [Candidatus Lokiarchaeota archaeon]